MWFNAQATRMITETFWIWADDKTEAETKLAEAAHEVEWGECWDETHDSTCWSVGTRCPEANDLVWGDGGWILGSDCPEGETLP